MSINKCCKYFILFQFYKKDTKLNETDPVYDTFLIYFAHYTCMYDFITKTYIFIFFKHLFLGLN